MKKYLKYSYTELLAACEESKITLTEQMVTAVEMETRAQSKSNLWFADRAGRITVPKMKCACHTDPSHPSQALIKPLFIQGHTRLILRPHHGVVGTRSLHMTFTLCK